MKVQYYKLDQGIVLQPISLEFRFCPSNPDIEVSWPKRSRFSNMFLGFLLFSVLRSKGLEYPHTRILVMQFHDWLKTVWFFWSKSFLPEVLPHPCLCLPAIFAWAQVIMWLTPDSVERIILFFYFAVGSFISVFYSHQKSEHAHVPCPSWRWTITMEITGGL